ncbi:MAG: hypothetical protein B6D56_08305 [Candidatus Omnitrophica bacterium 4484_70.1]|nr:MAG: hypothetical protein B6D56_08305 [Candidatus Omnitrophica bacterium 4484_70.1]
MIIIFIIFILLYSIIFHELAHGWTAYKLGDSTPKLAGRLTFNPFAHIDLIGTIILPVLLLIISKGNVALGFAKPVPINPYNFKNPKRDIMWVGVAGPLANILLALFFVLLIKLDISSHFLYMIFSYGIFINLLLAIFNLLPIPPLDGSRIIVSFLTSRGAYLYLKSEIIGIIVILILIYSGFLQWFIFPIIKSIFYLVGINFELFG